MALVALTATATVTLDGRILSNSGTFLVDIDELTEQTATIDADFELITDADVKAVFYTVINQGSTDAVVRGKINTNEYLFFGLPAGGHLVLPGVGAQDTTMHGIVEIAASTAGGSTRLLVFAGLHA